MATVNLIGDLEIRQGATWRFRFTYTDPTTGEPIDLTGATAQMMFRAGHESEALLTLTDEDGLTIGDEEGYVQVEISAEQSLALPKGRLFHDLLLTMNGGDTIRLIEGYAEISRSITREEE